MKITKLSQSKKVPDRWYLELENGETIKVGLAHIADFSLFVGRELEEAELAELRSNSAESCSKARALRIIGSRQMSRREITERLTRKGESAENAQAAADFLERIGALNDEEYAASIVRHYSARGYGEGRIRSELSRRGVPREMWESALSMRTVDADVIDRFIINRLRGGTPDRKALKKLTDALLRRGFSWEEIKEALERNRAAEDLD